MNKLYFENNWKDICRMVKDERMSTGIFLEEGKPASYDGKTLTVVFPKQFIFHCECLKAPKQKKIIEAVISDLFQKPVEVEFTIEKELPDVIKKAMDIFGGEMI